PRRASPGASGSRGSDRAHRRRSRRAAAPPYRTSAARADGIGAAAALAHRPLALARICRCGEPAERSLRISFAGVKPVWSDPLLALAPPIAFSERSQDLLRGDRSLVEAHADRVVHRVGDGRDHGVQRSLSGLLRAERTFGVDALDHDRFQYGCIERGWDLVVEERRLLVQAAAEDLLLADDLAVAHVRRTLDLPLNVRRIERAAAIVRRRHLVDRDHAGV